MSLSVFWHHFLIIKVTLCEWHFHILQTISHPTISFEHHKNCLCFKVQPGIYFSREPSLTAPNQEEVPLVRLLGHHTCVVLSSCIVITHHWAVTESFSPPMRSPLPGSQHTPYKSLWVSHLTLVSWKGNEGSKARFYTPILQHEIFFLPHLLWAQPFSGSWALSGTQKKKKRKKKFSPKY